MVRTVRCWTACGATETPAGVVLLGYGNPLRGDDGVGWRVAEAAAGRWAGKLVVRTGQQLVPEWAADLANATVACFVDASVAVDEPTLEALAADAWPPPIDGHDLGPAQLLQLTSTVFGRAPEAFVLHVPAVNFAFGEELSAVAARGVEGAIRLLETALDDTGDR